MQFSAVQILIGGLLALLAAIGGAWLGWLSLDGALAAFGMGLIVFGLGGLPWALVLLTFFVSASFLSVLFKKRKALANKVAAKGSRRDAAQVLANGGLAALFVLLYMIFPGSAWPWIGFAAAFAAANADTWATEIGTLSKRLPVRITDGREMPAGTSGAVSWMGTLGSIGGAMLVALVAWLVWPWVSADRSVWSAVVIAFAGSCGSLVDSFLGATLQRVNYCAKCNEETERYPYHSCGNETEYKRGWPWLENDWVNFLCTLAAALLAILLIGASGLIG